MAAPAPVPETQLREWGHMLVNPTTPLTERFRALYGLRHAAEPLSVEMIAAGFVNPSALLKHEMAYCLGQKQMSSAIPILTKLLEDEKQEAIVRHEAAEALGAIGDPQAVAVLQKHANHPIQAISETCGLALKRIEWLKAPEPNVLTSKDQLSVDPAPPFPDQPVDKLRAILLDHSKPMFDRFRAMFTLRNKVSEAPSHEEKKAAVLALVDGLAPSVPCGPGITAKDSSLFRHEVAYVLGQVAHADAEHALGERLKDTNESHMVRHESAEALGNINNPSCKHLLTQYLGDKELVVKESCIVALDIQEYQNSAEFQYAKTPSGV